MRAGKHPVGHAGPPLHKTRWHCNPTGPYACPRTYVSAPLPLIVSCGTGVPKAATSDRHGGLSLRVRFETREMCRGDPLWSPD